MSLTIEQVATRERAIGQMHVQWIADRARLELGLARAVGRNEKPGPTPARFLPLFNGYCLLVVDRPLLSETPIYRQMLTERGAA